MRRLFTAVLAIFLSLNCFGQARTITARVVDADNQQPVKNAAVIVAGTTSGNFTNYLGFFQLELAKGYNDLIISHVGYETGKVKIPPTDKFTIELNPEKQVLKPLNLSFFPKDSLAIKADDSPVKTRDNLVRHNAEFVGGWEEFYLELGNRITKSENFKNTDSYSTVSFEVTEKGKVSVIEIDPDTSLNKDVIYKALTALEGWKPARQHNFPESQTFSIPILVDSSDVAIIPEDPALPVGGYESFYRYVGDNLRYPAEARRMGIEGKVYIQFVVQRDGSLAEVEVIKGIGAGCDIEVMRVLKGSPKWTPARNKGLPVKQRIVLPVTYLLGASGGNFDVGNIPDSALISGVVLTAYGVEREKSRLKIWESEKFEEKPLYPYTSAEIRKFVKKNKKEIKVPIPPNRYSNWVYLELTVDENGEIKDIVVTKSLGTPFDEEAVRLYSEMPKMTLPLEDVKPLEAKYTATVHFGNISSRKVLSAHKNFNSGIKLYKNGKLERALDKFYKAIALNPTDLDYYFNKAAILIEMDRQSEACSTLSLIKDSDQEALDLYNSYCKDGRKSLP